MSTLNLTDASISSSEEKKTDWHKQLCIEFNILLGKLSGENSDLNDVNIYRYGIHAEAEVLLNRVPKRFACVES